MIYGTPTDQAVTVEAYDASTFAMELNTCFLNNPNFVIVAAEINASMGRWSAVLAQSEMTQTRQF